MSEERLKHNAVIAAVEKFTAENGPEHGEWPHATYKMHSYLSDGKRILLITIFGNPRVYDVNETGSWFQRELAGVIGLGLQLVVEQVPFGVPEKEVLR